MKPGVLILYLDTSNDAFKNAGIHEIRRILKELESQGFPKDEGDEHRLRDINGNQAGYIRYTPFCAACRGENGEHTCDMDE